ncbi:hypothetical protein EMEDMD4_650034 [Sinorhizobium medicae]|uniref:Uncharacterized protein n=1 Tax=Sinorhizobium medicae TaxID=110321 RepID=A0A508X4H7_9HYPH|nr:hypothetical protein EMEDMD4_650034 [Sinorhizobium medicae]
MCRRYLANFSSDMTLVFHPLLAFLESVAEIDPILVDKIDHATVFDGVRFDIRDGGSDFIPVFLCRTIERPTSVCLFLQLLDRFRIIVIELQELCGVKFGSLPLFLWHHHPRVICGIVAVGTCLEVMHAHFRDFDRIDNAFEIACVEVLLHRIGDPHFVIEAYRPCWSRDMTAMAEHMPG